MHPVIKGCDVRRGMLVREVSGPNKGRRLIVEGVSGSMWHVRQARKDWLPDLRYMGWTGHLDPASEWEFCGGRTDQGRTL